MDNGDGLNTQTAQIVRALDTSSRNSVLIGEIKLKQDDVREAKIPFLMERISVIEQEMRDGYRAMETALQTMRGAVRNYIVVFSIVMSAVIGIAAWLVVK